MPLKTDLINMMLQTNKKISTNPVLAMYQHPEGVRFRMVASPNFASTRQTCRALAVVRP